MDGDSSRPHPRWIGEKTEAVVLAEFLRRDYVVLVPFGQCERYDFVIERDGRFVRVQCKTGRLRSGAVIFNAYSAERRRTAQKTTRGYRGEADVFVVWCPDTGKLYWIPVEVVGETEVSLRFTAKRNWRSKRIKWAKEFELPG